MRVVRYAALVVSVAAFASFAACTGGSRTTPPVVSQSSASSPSSSAQTNYVLRETNGAAGTLSLRSQPALPADAVSLEGAELGGITPQRAHHACPIATITIRNPHKVPVTIQIVGFTITLHCIVPGTLFGVSFFQTHPQPQVIEPVKLGDITAKGSTITFTPTQTTLTLPPRTTSAIAVRSEDSTSEVTMPVAPGSTTVLTANAPNLPSALSFTYQTASGGTTYSTGCFLAHDGSGALVPALRGVPLVGTPSFYCHIDTGDANITFGTTVQFTISAPKADASIFEMDGEAQGFACTTGATQCNVPSFTIPTVYQNAIVGNVLDLKLCVPATPNTDCNNVGNSAWPPPATTTARAGRDFQLLVADDPTYKPGTASAPVPWDGKFRLSFSGPCHLSTGPDPSNGDVPPSPFPGQPGYSDNEQQGVGPYAEFDVAATGAGVCAISVTEDPKYITDYTDPAHPKTRTSTIAVTLK